jgi:hypothetical protein
LHSFGCCGGRRQMYFDGKTFKQEGYFCEGLLMDENFTDGMNQNHAISIFVFIGKNSNQDELSIFYYPLKNISKFFLKSICN